MNRTSINDIPDPIRPNRIMWLLNHPAARAFELPILKKVGFSEIFLPKSYPDDPDFARTADVVFDEDKNLSLPAEELALLNKADWYQGRNRDAWEIANRRFSTIITIVYCKGWLKTIASRFNGAVIWRAFGLGNPAKYQDILEWSYSGDPMDRNHASHPWLGIAYKHITSNDSELIRERSVFLPLGLASSAVSDTWTGEDPRILFVCSGINVNDYYRNVYNKFISDFKGFPYIIGGNQILPVSDPSVVGFLPKSEHEGNMRRLRAMYYHSQEPNHVHYHPFEAIRRGMPLVYMAGGMLDRLGGKDLPGRCTTIAEARSHLRRILDGDSRLIERIRTTQVRLLDHMSPAWAEPHWHSAFQRIRAETVEAPRKAKRKRIAVVLPIGYRGGTLRGALSLAEALHRGSHLRGEPAEVVFAHLDDTSVYGGDHAIPELDGISIRPFQWRWLDRATAKRTLHFAGLSWEPQADSYITPDERLSDCDLLVFVSDRLPGPLLPLKPYAMLVFDYLQRYVDLLPAGADEGYLHAARQALRVLVTTRFTESDALQYAGVSRDRLIHVPMLAPDFSGRVEPALATHERPFFIWTTNAATHKNHLHALKALAAYYEQHQGTLDCLVTGVGSSDIPRGGVPHLAQIPGFLAQHSVLRKRLHWRGELADVQYRGTLAQASFLWHAGRIDNGTFSVIEAAHLGIPALSSDYPAMREIDAQFQLNLRWMNPLDPADMARQLKTMEKDAQNLRSTLPTRESLLGQDLQHLAPAYWEAVRSCL